MSRQPLRPKKTPETATDGEWDRQADCFPDTRFPGSGSFSIGVFQWTRSKTAGRMKKCAATRRVHGANSDHATVLTKADAIVADLNAQLFLTRAKGESGWGTL